MVCCRYPLKWVYVPDAEVRGRVCVCECAGGVRGRKKKKPRETDVPMRENSPPFFLPKKKIKTRETYVTALGVHVRQGTYFVVVGYVGAQIGTERVVLLTDHMLHV